MKAEIITIGSELTCGALLDTNSQWLSRELEGRGCTVQRHTTIADDREAMIQAYQEAAQRSRLVFIAGGLGPTLDDITRETLAAAFGQKLVEDRASLHHIEALFQTHGRDMPARNAVQALRPEHSESIHNAHGTAPGILMELSDPECMISVMPGVPSEMKRMFHEQVVGRLPPSPVFVRRSVIRTFGFGESAAERRLGDLTARGQNPEVGITASRAVISLSITARAASEHECDLLTTAAREQVFERLGDAVFGEGDVELSQVVAGQLTEQGRRVALLEGPATGGLIGQWLTQDSGVASRLGYSRLFPTAEAMTDAEAADDWEAVLRQQGETLLAKGTADYVVLTSPTEIVDDSGVRKRQGSVIVFGSGLDKTHDCTMSGDLSIFRHRAANSALNLLRLHLNAK